MRIDTAFDLEEQVWVVCEDRQPDGIRLYVAPAVVISIQVTVCKGYRGEVPTVAFGPGRALHRKAPVCKTKGEAEKHRDRLQGDLDAVAERA